MCMCPGHCMWLCETQHKTFILLFFSLAIYAYDRFYKRKRNK